MHFKRTAPVPATFATLFLVCLKVGSLSFGGGLSGWIHREFVEHHNWITEEEFAANLAMAQILPGPNVLNLVIGLGNVLGGAAGAAACALGLLATPFFAVIALAAATERTIHLQGLEWMLEGVAFAAIGMLMAIGFRGVARARRDLVALTTILIIAIGVGFIGWPMPTVVLVVGPFSILVAAVRARFGG